MADAAQDPLEFLKSLWGSMGFTPPGMVTPTLDVNELDKRITDLKAVEGWLKMNLNMLQMSIQGMEMQRATITAFQTMSQSQGGAEAPANPFANPPPNSSAWPWNMMQPPAGATAPKEQEQTKASSGRKKK